MAGAGYLVFTAGQVLTAAQVNTYLNQQTLMVFASAAARDTALASVKAQGMIAYLKDVHLLTVYTGTAWSSAGPIDGAYSSWTPVVVQSTTPTLTIPNGCGYSRYGRKIDFDALVTITSTATAANPVTITVPVPISTRLVNGAGSGYVGVGSIIDTSASLVYYGDLVVATSTTLKFLNVTTTTPFAYYGNGGFTAALANGDTVSAWGSYEAATDA
jgi:hypothetical protein